MRDTTFLIKPASSLCNLRCKYCFYEDISDNRAVKSNGIMGEAVARNIIEKAFQATDINGSIHFMFQGGEPTVAGLSFFQDFIQMEKEYQQKNIKIYHAIQTNGIVIDAGWAEFFRENHFLVGLSVDGTREIHDQFRADSKGCGTWQQVTHTLKLLEEYHVETHLLCVVTRQAAKKPQRVWKSLVSLGGHALQFIPCLDPLELPRGTCSYSLTPDLYGRFLCNLFDCWYQAWKSGQYVSIRLFDDYIRILSGNAPSCCAASGSCGNYLVAESDGSLYPCDFFVLDQWYMGNICTCTVEEAIKSAPARKFIEDGRKRPSDCYPCPYLQICRGGCKRDWTQQRKNYYCSSFQQFFTYALPRLKEMADCIR